MSPRHFEQNLNNLIEKASAFIIPQRITVFLLNPLRYHSIVNRQNKYTFVTIQKQFQHFQQLNCFRGLKPAQSIYQNHSPVFLCFSREMSTKFRNCSFSSATTSITPIRQISMNLFIDLKKYKSKI